MLKFEDIYKSFSSHTIFNGISHSFDRGTYTLQGQNGVGKSTLLKMLAGAIPADSGRIWINNISLTESPKNARSYLSYVPDESPVYPFITGKDFLEFVALAKKTTLDNKVMKIVDNFGLTSHLESRFSIMSIGTQKKFMLCAAWIGESKVLLIDEPSNAIDVSAKTELISLIQESSKNSTILFTSHDSEFVKATQASVIHMDNFLHPAYKK